MQQGLSCPQCGTPVSANQQFCGICGTKLTGSKQPQPNTCGQCGSPITPGQLFCAVCGTKLITGSQSQQAQTIVKPAQQRSSIVRTVPPTVLPSMPPPVQAGANVQMPRQEATGTKGTEKPKKASKYGMLRTGAFVFQILGWIILVGGMLASLSMAVFIIIGGQMMPVWGGSALDSGVTITVALFGFIASILYGVAFLAFGQLCAAVADMAQKIQ